MPQETTNIYGLVDPETKTIRYVGKSNNPDIRYRKHLKDGRDRNKKDHKTNWVASILAKGQKPVLIILEICNHKEWKKREQYWIAKLKNEGVDLTNSKDGGEGLNLTSEARERMRQARLGKPSHNKGKQTALEVRKKQSEAAKKRWANMSDEQRQQIIKYNLTNRSGSRPGWKHTAEAKRKIAESEKGNTKTKGHRLSDEHKRKLSEARKGKKRPLYVGKNIAMAKRQLTDAQLSEIHQMLGEKIKQRDIADRFGISEQVISSIKHKKTYKNYE